MFDVSDKALERIEAFAVKKPMINTSGFQSTEVVVKGFHIALVSIALSKKTIKF